MKLSVFQGRWGARIGLFLALLLVLFLLQRRFYQPFASVAPISSPRSSSEMHQNWRVGVKDILRRYDEDKNAVQARDALLALTVTRDDQSAHLALVLAFNALAEGRTEGRHQLDEVRRMIEAS